MLATKIKHTDPLLEATIRDDDGWVAVVLELEVVAAAEVEGTPAESICSIKWYGNISHK